MVDQTGLPGYYDFTLEFAPDFGGRTGRNGDAPPTFNGPTLFAALREQLGLKVESTKAPVEVYVIEHVEKPSAN